MDHKGAVKAYKDYIKIFFITEYPMTFPEKVIQYPENRSDTWQIYRKIRTGSDEIRRKYMYRKRRAGSGKKGKLLAVLAVIVIAAVYYYVAIPAVNIHSSGFWMFLIALVVLGLLFYGGRKGIHSKEEVKSSKILKLGIGLVVVLVLVYFAGSILSSPIVNAKNTGT